MNDYPTHRRRNIPIPLAPEEPATRFIVVRRLKKYHVEEIRLDGSRKAVTSFFAEPFAIECRRELQDRADRAAIPPPPAAQQPAPKKPPSWFG